MKRLEITEQSIAIRTLRKWAKLRYFKAICEFLRDGWQCRKTIENIIYPLKWWCDWNRARKRFLPQRYFGNALILLLFTCIALRKDPLPVSYLRNWYLLYVSSYSLQANWHNFFFFSLMMDGWFVDAKRFSSLDQGHIRKRCAAKIWPWNQTLNKSLPDTGVSIFSVVDLAVPRKAFFSAQEQRTVV